MTGCSHSDLVQQTSTIDALLQGEYAPLISVAQLKKQGDTGIGTFEHLDGEMIMLGGKVYQVRSDGTIHQRSNDTMLPFATVKFFHADQTLQLNDAMSFQQFTAAMDKILPTANWFDTFIAHGTFKFVKTRSVPRQSPPYPPLIEVVKQQPTWTFENVIGTLVGFRCPSFTKGLNVPGYHLHFLRDDHTGGGHVLDFQTSDVTVQIDSSRQWQVTLPDTEFYKNMNLAQDRSKELHKVEKDK
jgi:acetolactate decarboxylase